MVVVCVYTITDELFLLLPSLDPNDIVDGNTKLVLGILWRFIFKYHISASLRKPQAGSGKSESETDGGTISQKEMTAS